MLAITIPSGTNQGIDRPLRRPFNGRSVKGRLSVRPARPFPPFRRLNADMKILLTGASSFTGSWFVQELAGAGHEVTATFRGSREDYSGVRADRVEAVARGADCVWGVEFGDDGFLDLVGTRDFDLLLHHGAEMTDYRSWDFDPIQATAKNTRSVRQVLQAVSDRGGHKIIVTGSVFEPYEGVGSPGARAFNPYGLSKHLSFEVIRMEAERLGLSLGKFVIPNPFGPREEFRFTSYLAKEWSMGNRPVVGTPAYVRDNIHVSLLALAYRDMCETLPSSAGLVRKGASGYVEQQGAFTHRFAREIAARTPWACEFSNADQKDFPEPLFRTNAALWAADQDVWSEGGAWDGLAAYYLQLFPG